MDLFGRKARKLLKEEQEEHAQTNKEFMALKIEAHELRSKVLKFEEAERTRIKEADKVKPLQKAIGDWGEGVRSRRNG